MTKEWKTRGVTRNLKFSPSSSLRHSPFGIRHCLLPLLLGVTLLLGCRAKPQSPAERTAAAHALFDQATKEFHTPSAEAQGTERQRLLDEAARSYERLLAEFPEQRDLGVQALRGLGGIRASQGKTNEAVRLYAAVGEKYPERDWEVLQAWKAAADLLWDAQRPEEAKKFYAQIVARFDKQETPQIYQTVVRGSKARLTQ